MPRVLDMRGAWLHVDNMSMIQIRNVPEEMHRELKARAARAGMTLSDYLMDVIRKVVERPEPDVFLKRLRGRTPVHTTESSEAVIRAMRDAG